ncbi:MAG: hypothetical protein GX309_11860 [Clostridiales bacterium]|nr:hypothetical protein [Clostridiales bacterium]
MRKIISLMLIIASCFILAGCHKTTDDEQNVIDCLDRAEKIAEDGLKYVGNKEGTQYGTYENELQKIKNDIGETTGIGDVRVDKVDSYVKENNLEYEHKAYEDLNNAELELMEKAHTEEGWEDIIEKIKSIKKEYKNNIKNRN